MGSQGPEEPAVHRQFLQGLRRRVEHGVVDLALVRVGDGMKLVGQRERDEEIVDWQQQGSVCNYVLVPWQSGVVIGMLGTMSPIQLLTVARCGLAVIARGQCSHLLWLWSSD